MLAGKDGRNGAAASDRLFYEMERLRNTVAIGGKPASFHCATNVFQQRVLWTDQNRNAELRRMLKFQKNNSAHMLRLLWRAAVIPAVLLTGYLLYIAKQIDAQSTVDEARTADVIIIMGAAEYRGRPSHVLRARIDHALDLYRRKLAPRIMTTGGAGGDPVYTEGEVARNYLVRQGVPSEMILVENEADSTWKSTAIAAEMMRRMNLNSAIVVSDGYHIFRAKKMLEFRGIAVYGSPRPGEVQGPWRERWLLARQGLGYLLWQAGFTM